MKNSFTLFKTVLLLLIVLINFRAIAQSTTGSIKGQILSSDGKPVEFVTIKIKEARKQTVTGEDGTYQFKNLQQGNYTLTATYVGRHQQVMQVTVETGKIATLNFTLLQSATQLGEVGISAGKTINRTPVSFGKADISPMDLPQSTGVVSSKVIEDQQINRLGDAVKNVSGVTLTQTRGGVGETFSARGSSIGIGGGSGSIFKDGVLTNTAGFPEASTLESVEILKGSSALLYGNVSGGLIINMVTKKPKFESGGEVSMRYGSYNMYKPTIDVYGPISKDLAFRVVGTYENDGSYRNSVKTERAYVNPSLLYNIDKSTSLLVVADYLKSNLTPDWGVGSLNNGLVIPTSVPRSQFINTSWAYSHMNQYSGSLNLNHKFNDVWHGNIIASAQSTNIDSYGTSLPNTVSSTGDWNRGLARANTTENSYTAQTNLNGQFKTGAVNHQILIGTDVAKVLNISNGYSLNGKNISSYVYDKINTLDLNAYTQRTDVPNPLDTARITAPVYRFGAYAQDLISLTDKFKVLAGIRWSWQQTNQTNIVDPRTNAQTNGTADTRYDRAFTPKASLIYQPIPTSSVYVSYTRNFMVNTGTNVATGQGLAPSNVDQYEAGTKNELFDGKVAVNVSVYTIVNSNLAVVSPVDASGNPNTITTVKTFSGETRSNGVEIDITGNLSKNFYFITGYGYNHAYYTHTTGLPGSNFENEPLVINPAHTANASLFYTFTHANLKGFKLGASAFYTGFRYAGYNTTVALPNAKQTYRLLPIGGFATLDLSAGYTYRKVSILASVTNVTNTMNYLIHDNYSITPIPPTQFLTTLAYKF